MAQPQMGYRGGSAQPPFDAENRYASKFVQAHRGDFHALLIDVLEPGTVRFGKRLHDLDIAGGGVDLQFDDGTKVHADIVIGADGIRSQVRQVLGGVEEPKYMGEVGHRAIFPTELLGGYVTPDYTKWWGEVGEFRMCNHYYFTADRKEYSFTRVRRRRTGSTTLRPSPANSTA